jgi:hypothetical protein
VATDTFETSRIVNTITAGPLLNLMLALAGMESPEEPARAWEVFKRFARAPSTSSHDVIAFQVGWIEVDGGDPLLSCSWVRQLTDDAAGYGDITRAVQLEYGYDEKLLHVPNSIDVWSDEFPSLAEFFEAVERQSQFGFMMETAASISGVYVRDDDGVEP